MSWLIGQVRQSNADVRTGTAVTEAMLRSERPDAVILAAGGEKIIPDIPGIHEKIVCDAWQILGGEISIGVNVVIIGGGLIGMETADFVTVRGGRVTITEALKVSPVLPLTSHGYMLHKRLRGGGCRFLYDTCVEEVGDGWVNVQTSGVGEHLAPVDQVIIAVGMKSKDRLKAVLESIDIPYITAGDVRQPRRIIDATEEGARAAWKIYE
jgi:pyruvate/2-oxoglutarate dehydrogenase complex dihydrolipoamide dehydrogenase (E3) component